MDKRNVLRSLPAVDAVLKVPAAMALIDQYGRSSVASAIRTATDSIRRTLLAGQETPAAKTDVIAAAREQLESAMRPRLRRAVNATGIILHTGLGRAYMPDAAREALAELTGYCNIQMDLANGERIQREDCIKDLVRELTGAEDAVLVNNNAGATLLVLKSLAENREVIISRGELIEIGGSFRLPEIMKQSGAILRETGATNKTHLNDYEKAIGENTGLMMKAHKSNYCIVGFADEVGIADIAALGKKAGIPVIDDLGCGALIALEAFGLDHEMTVRQSLDAGADLALFSTDKLIGGPQGGLIVGRRDLLKTVRSHPLYRALRVGKMALAALEATLRIFRAPELLAQKHPLYRMLARTPPEMDRQARELAGSIRSLLPDWSVAVEEDLSYLGGGALPGSSMPSVALQVTSGGMSAEDIARKLRSAETPVIPHVRDNAVLINLRTVLPEDSDDILAACKN